MSRKMLVDAVHPEETRVIITDSQSSILEFDFTTAAKPQIKGNVYLAKVTRVEPSLQAAFVEYGGGKQGFLPFSEIHPNYYQIPSSDKEKLLEEEAEESRKELEEEESEIEEAFDSADSPSAIAAQASENDEEVLKSDVVASNEDSEDTNDIEDDSNEENEGDEGSGKSQSGSNRRRRRGGRYRNRRRRRDNSSDRDNSSEEGVETISGEEEIERPRHQRNYMRRYKIQEVIKRNQVLLVQVIKEERGNKGVSLTSFLSLAGRYCVLMPNSPRGGGVSRKIGNGEDRKRLKKVVADLNLPEGMNVIIRTAGAGRTKAEIRRDFDYLVKLWNQIREDTLSSSAPALVYEESNIIQRTIRDSYHNDIEEIWVDGEETYKHTKSFMRKLIPSHAPRVKLHKDDTPLFVKHGIENQLLSMTEPEVRLKSGGSIVMMPTEALISIDVNSGRSTKERNVEETATKTNLEAAREVARQLRLRDLAGLIVVDFIDMTEGKNRRAVERALKEALKHDRAKIQVGRISAFGLLEMSRQRLRPSISESINRMCPHCQGTGQIRSEATVAIQIIRNLEKEASTGNFEKFKIHVTQAEALHILNHMRTEIDKICNTFDCEIEIHIDDSLLEGNYRLEKLRGSRKNQPQKSNDSSKKPSSRQKAKSKEDDTKADETSQDEEANEAEDGEKKPRKSRSRRKPSERGRKSKKSDNSEEKVETSEEDKKTDTDEKPEKKEPEEGKPERKTRSTTKKRSPRKKADQDTSDAANTSKEEEKPKQKKQSKQEDTSDTEAESDDASRPKRRGWWQKIMD